MQNGGLKEKEENTQYWSAYGLKISQQELVISKTLTIVRFGRASILFLLQTNCRRMILATIVCEHKKVLFLSLCCLFVFSLPLSLYLIKGSLDENKRPGYDAWPCSDNACGCRSRCCFLCFLRTRQAQEGLEQRSGKETKIMVLSCVLVILKWTSEWAFCWQGGDILTVLLNLYHVVDSWLITPLIELNILFIWRVY